MVSVVIVGAGAAGLTAAYDLIRTGDFTVTVLESNSYIGGRVKKVPEGFADFPIDAGGEWIQHEDGHGMLVRILDGDTSRLDEIDVIPYLPVYKYSEDNGTTFENETYFVTSEQPYFHFVNYTWFDFFNDFIAPISKNYTNFDCVVNSIDYSILDKPATVNCTDGRTFEGDYVIVAVPLSVLQHPSNITFVPSLPANKLSAFGNVLMAPGAKLFLKFKDKFYYDAFQLSYQDSFYNERFYYDVAWGQESDENVLGVFILDEEENEPLTGQSKDYVTTVILQDLDLLFDGKASQLFIDSYFQDWTAERFIRGLYSLYDESTQYERVIDVFRKPVDRLFFAGEYVPIDDWYGYVHGAALSGRLAASKVQQSAVSAAVPRTSPSLMVIMLLGSTVGTFQLLI